MSVSIASFDGQERKLLAAAKAGRVDQVVAFLNQGVHIRCKDKVRLG